MHLCFVCPYAYPIFRPELIAAGGVGGSEVRAYTFARQLVDGFGYQASFFVFGEGRGPIEEKDGITIYTNPVRRLIPSRRQRLSRKFHDGRLRGFASSVQQCILASQLVGYKIGDLMSQQPTPRELADSKQRGMFLSVESEVMDRIGADCYCAFGANWASAQVAHYCRERGLPFVLFIAGDGDLAEEVSPSSTTLNDYGMSGSVCYSALKEASCIVAQTDDQRDRLAHRFGFQSVKIMNPFDMTKVPAVRPPPSRSQFLWIGKSHSIKGPKRLFQLARATSEVRYKMVLNRGCEALHRELIDSCPRNVQIIPHLSRQEIGEELEASTALVNTSESEGFPNTFLEAASRGVPLISWKVDPDNFIEQTHCGYVANCNFEQLVSSIKDVSDPSTNRELGLRGREYVAAAHDLEVVVRLLDEQVFGKFTRATASGT